MRKKCVVIFQYETNKQTEHTLTFKAVEYFTKTRNSSAIAVAPSTQVTHVRNKNSNIQGRSLNAIEVIFNTIRNCS